MDERKHGLPGEVLHAVKVLFLEKDQERAKALLAEDWWSSVREIHRYQMAALNFSDGHLSKLEQAVAMGRRDYRLLVAVAIFAGNRWAQVLSQMKSDAEPSAIDVERLAAGIHDCVRAALTPLGFGRSGDEWRRSGEVEQSLRVAAGLTSRVETRFILTLTLEAKPLPLMLELPRPPWEGALFLKEGYVFGAGDREGDLYGIVDRDLASSVRPWFERFTTDAEVQRGFEDGTFKRSLKTPDRVILF